MIRIENSNWINPNSDFFRFIRIEEKKGYGLLVVFHQTRYESLFGLIRNDSKRFGMA